MTTPFTPISLDQVADRMEHMLLRYEELQKTNMLLQSQLQEAMHERDLLRSRLAAARARVDALLNRLPPAASAPGDEALAPHTAWGLHDDADKDDTP